MKKRTLRFIIQAAKVSALTFGYLPYSYDVGVLVVETYTGKAITKKQKQIFNRVYKRFLRSIPDKEYETREQQQDYQELLRRLDEQ